MQPHKEVLGVFFVQINVCMVDKKPDYLYNSCHIKGNYSMPSPLITVYARREPTRDLTALSLGMAHLRDVVIYRDKEATLPFCHFAVDASNKPTRRNKKIVLNCALWMLEWIDDLPALKGQSKAA